MHNLMNVVLFYEALIASTKKLAFPLAATRPMRESVHFAALRRLCKNDFYVRFRNASPSKLHLSVAPNSWNWWFLDLLKKTFKIDRISQFTARTFIPACWPYRLGRNIFQWRQTPQTTDCHLLARLPFSILPRSRLGRIYRTYTQR